ncbi:MAG: aminotransferase [Thermoplasmata archaeon HGW-Thermoplasmata-1]|nr:MAG: aminotransferase [Thermoplasmata archaeon HGW-Thermoplasmata-1]
MVLDVEDNIFMIPGPVKMHPRVTRAMSGPALLHRSPEFEECLADCRELTKYMFQTKSDVCILSGSGTAAMDAAINNVVRRGDRVVSLINGKFGERLADIADVYTGKNVTRLESAAWGQLEDLEKLEAELEKGDVKLLTMTHNETSCAFEHPAEKIGRMAKKHGVLFMADCITSVGCVDVRPDEWGIDICMTGSQKGVAAPAGLSMLAVSKHAQDVMHSENCYYLNVKKHLKKLNESDTPYTPAVPVFLAYREALHMLKEEGLENRFARIEKLANATRAAANALGLELFSDKNYLSRTVTAIKPPEGVKVGDIRKHLNDMGIMVAGAQDPYKGKFFRIGHMGITQMREIAATYVGLEAVLRKLGYNKFQPGASTAAIIDYM